MELMDRFYNFSRPYILEDDEVVVASSFEEFSEKILEYLQKEKIIISDENIIEFDDFG